MWKYQHPDFALFLLGELQKQQQGSIFCDTLLQTEGVCVPAHSCVLAALSPIFSRILSTSSAPHAGQNRLVSLEAVGSHALLKLVGFLYSGEMEIESRSEHEEVMAAAHRLGLRNLFGKKRVWVDRGVVDVGSCCKETSVQTEDSVKSQESEIVSEPLKTQSSTASVTSVQPCGLLGPDLPPSQSLEEVNPTRGLNLISNASVPSLADVTEASISDHHKTKAKRKWKMAKRESQLKKITRQQNQIKLLNVEGNKSNQIGVVEKSRNVSGKDFQKLLVADNGQKNTTTELKEPKLDQLKVKIKLSRRSGACWESNLLVSVQGESEKRPEEAKECGPRTQSCPSSVIPGQSLGTLTTQTDLPISPSNSSTHASSDKSVRNPHHISVSTPLDVPTLSSSPPQADESDEHIAMLLEDMFMMGLNILPLVPLDRNLSEQDHPGPSQEQKDGQKGTEASTQGPSLFAQSCGPEMRESDVSKTAIQAGSSGQKDKDHSGFHNQSSSNTVALLTLSPKQDHLNQVQNRATASRNSPPSLIKGLSLIPKATAVPNSVATGEKPSLDMTSILEDRPNLTLLQCLSPLESEKEDSDVPLKQEPSKPSLRQDSETQNLPLWLSESPLILDFPLSTMIDISHPRPQHDLDACKNRSCPDLPECQELKTSFSHNNLISGSSSNFTQPGLNDDSERPKQRRTRKRKIATQKSSVKGNTKCQNLEKGDEVQLRISKCDEPHSGDIKPSNSDTYGVSTRMTSASTRVASATKRRREITSPLSKKMPLLDAASKQHLTGVVKRGRGRPAKQRLTGVVKRGRGRPPKSEKNVAHLCSNAKKMPTSGQDDCEVEKTKTANMIEQGSKQEPNPQQVKDSTEMEEADVNGNFAPATPNSHFKYAGQAKGPSILDQIFHQAHSSVASQRDSSFSLQKFQGGKSDNIHSKSVMNSSELIKKDICGEKKAEMSSLINEKKDVEVSDNHARSPLSCGDMPDNVKYSGKDGDISMEDSSSRAATVLQNSDSQNEMGKDILDHTTEISVLLTSEKEIMSPDGDIDDAHDCSPTNTDYVVTTNEVTVMEGIEMNFCLNPDITQEEYVKNDLETIVSNERSFERTSDSEKKVQAACGCGVDSQDIDWVTDCLENNEEKDLGWNKDNQMIEETEDLRGHTFVEENGERWGTTKGSDDYYIDVEGVQNRAEMFDGQTLLEEEEGHITSAKTADEPSKGEIITDTPSVQADGSNFHSPNVCNEDVSMVLSFGGDSESKDDCHLDEEDIEVDVVGESVEKFPLGFLAAGQVVTLPVVGLLDQEDELDTTEEEEVDVTGEETE